MDETHDVIETSPCLDTLFPTSVQVDETEDSICPSGTRYSWKLCCFPKLALRTSFKFLGKYLGVSYHLSDFSEAV